MSHPCRIAAAVLVTLTALPALADGDPVKGATAFKKCAACHSVQQGGPPKAGPNLHDVVGRKSGALEGYAYSAAMRTLGDGGHLWTPEELVLYLENPKAMVPGTKMAFAGLKKPEERADVVAYLQSLTTP